jgi:hypothetical protein
MKAVVLVGGFGTRLRPLTETVKKELLPLVDRPILDHVLDHLARHGVHEVILSSPYLQEAFHPFIEARRGDPAITWITEAAPLGTGGAIVNALDAVGNEPFFALNGDILTDSTTGCSHRTEREASSRSASRGRRRAFGLVATDERDRVACSSSSRHPSCDVNGHVHHRSDRPPAVECRSRDPMSADLPVRIASGGLGVRVPADAYYGPGTPEKYLQAHSTQPDGKVHGVAPRRRIALTAVNLRRGIDGGSHRRRGSRRGLRAGGRPGRPSRSRR